MNPGEALRDDAALKADEAALKLVAERRFPLGPWRKWGEEVLRYIHKTHFAKLKQSAFANAIGLSQSQISRRVLSRETLALLLEQFDIGLSQLPQFPSGDDWFDAAYTEATMAIHEKLMTADENLKKKSFTRLHEHEFQRLRLLSKRHYNQTDDETARQTIREQLAAELSDGNGHQWVTQLDLEQLWNEWGASFQLAVALIPDDARRKPQRCHSRSNSHARSTQ